MAERAHTRTYTRWSPAMDAVLRRDYPSQPAAAVAAALGCTASAVYLRAKALGLAKEPGFAARVARATTLARSVWTPELREIAELMFPVMLNADLAELLGLKVSQVAAWGTKRGLHKEPAVLSQAARERTLAPGHGSVATRFKPGQRPHNTGVKGWRAGGRSVETQFKPGQRGSKWVPVGSYRVNSEGVLDQKVADTGRCNVDWKAVHRLVWEAHHGPVPAGHVVRWRPGMRTTVRELITLDRLELASRADIARSNAWHSNLSPELRGVMGARLALQRAMKRAHENLESQQHE